MGFLCVFVIGRAKRDNGGEERVGEHGSNGCTQEHWLGLKVTAATLLAMSGCLWAAIRNRSAGVGRRVRCGPNRS